MESQGATEVIGGDREMREVSGEVKKRNSGRFAGRTEDSVRLNGRSRRSGGV